MRTASVISCVAAVLGFVGCGLDHDDTAEGVPLLQPLHVSLRREDMHIIAFLAKHPDYEAVEAMIGRRRGQPQPLIRAILTRHDKTQVDHINDEGVVEERHRSDPLRETHFSPMEFVEEREGDLPRVFLRFTSFRSEDVVFDLHAATPVLAEFGGLTDPLGHARSTVLPVMWRDASTLANPVTRVTFDGRAYEIPVEIQSGSFTGLEAFYTDGFTIAVIAASDRDVTLMDQPERLAIGARWIYGNAGERTIYEVRELTDDVVVVEKTGGSEVLEGEVVDGQVHLRQITFRATSETPAVFTIAFAPALPPLFQAPDPPALQFHLSIDEHADLVTGSAVIEHTGPQEDDVVLRLIPEQPEWAIDRIVRVAISQIAGTYRLRQTIERLPD